MAAKIAHEDLITCPICFEKLTYPKQLPCLHTFCHQCLQSYIITHLGGEGKKGQDFPCPVCRQMVSITDRTLSSDKIADTIPENHLIKSLMERSRETENPKNANVCDPCGRDNIDLAATFKCTFCLESLCENCVITHKRLNQSRHVLIPVEEIVDEKTGKMLDVDEPCLKHTGKILEVFCIDHMEMCCVICLATLHRKCEHISTFEDMVNGAKKTETLEQFNNKLCEMDKKSDELRSRLEDSVCNLNIKHGEITRDVLNIVQKSKEKLVQLQTKFEQNFHQKHKKESFIVTEKKERIEIFQNSVKKGQKLLQAVSEYGSPKQQFITKEKIKQQLKVQMKSLWEDIQDVKCVDYTLKVDDTLTSVAHSVESLAEVEVKLDPNLTANLKDTLHVIHDLCVEEVDDGTTITQKPVDIGQLEVTKLHDIRTQNEELVGGTYLPDGRIVLCNYTGSKLLLCGPNGKCLFEQKQLQRPTDACSLTGNEIIVAFTGQDFIKKYSVKQDAFIETCKIKCKLAPWGLTATKDAIIVGYPREIDVLSFDGAYIKTLSSKQAEELSYVSVSRTGNVYYSDGDIIMCKSQDGTELTRYTHPQLKRVLGITLDKFGYVYVCGNNSKNLVVFSPDGSRSKILLNNLNNPYQIGFDTKGEHFFIANGRNSNGLYKCSFTE